jgi:hypothetical protein
MPIRAHGPRRPAACAWALAIAGLAVAPLHAFEIVATHPARYALGEPIGTRAIEVVFDAPVAPPPAGAVRVAGSMSGLHPGTLEAAGDTLRLTQLQRPFMAGELVHVGLHRDLAAQGGGTLAGGRYFAFTIASRPCTPNWSQVEVFGTAARPYFIHGGDLDGDGHPDLAVPNEDSNDVSIFRNLLGTGDFPTHSEFGVGARPSSIFGEDFDGDGDQDLATADIIGSSVSVLRNDGAGQFTLRRSYAAGIQTRQIHGGDFDGDNDVDLCSTSFGSGEVYLFYNRGDGSFGPIVSYPNLPAGPFAIRTGDLDGDGHLDVAVACQGADSLVVLRNDGGGTFAATGRWAVGDGPWCLNGNDFDADGDFDLVSVASFADRLVLLRNDGNGGFGSRASLASGDFPLGVYCADVDGDGDVDATAACFSGARLDLYLNDGSGTLAPAGFLPVAAAASYAWAHDLDRDGDLDLSVVDELADQLWVFRNGGTATGVPNPADTGARLGLRVGPNPLRAGPGARLRVAALHRGAPLRLEVTGVDGRRVRRWSVMPGGAAQVDVHWDGCDAGGRPVAAGRYFVSARQGRQVATCAVQVLR